MKKLIYLLPILALLVSSCSEKNELTGTLPNSDNDGKQVFMLRLKDYNSSFEPTDSTVITNNKFVFKLEETTEPSVAYIFIKDMTPGMANGIPFVYENGSIKISIDSLAHVKGTPMNEKCQVFFDGVTGVIKKINTLETQIQSTTDTTLQNDYIDQMQVLNDSMATIGYDFVIKNIQNKVGEFYFISMMSMFDDEQINEVLANARPEYKKIIDDILNMNRSAVKQSQLSGQQFIDITGNNPDGKKISLADYVRKNKVVLVDFWASWCGPCIKEMPNVVAAYQQYKSKGFEIVGISLDQDKDAWTKAITNLNMTWPQMSDLKGWESELSAPYNVTSIPFTLLIDQNGTIIAENLRGEQLHAKLQELLK